MLEHHKLLQQSKQLCYHATFIVENKYKTMYVIHMAFFLVVG